MWANIPLSVGDAPVLAHVPRERRVAQPDRHVEEAPIGPVVIAVEVPDEFVLMALLLRAILLRVRARARLRLMGRRSGVTLMSHPRS